jgi:NADPH-dependent glutamate synthase beta subunit-like oxidoreductase
MREVHRYVADAVYRSPERFETLVARLLEKRLAATGKRVAIVGSGPAGLTAAFYLALLGHEVIVYESRAEPGGMLRYALPEYRLPKDVLDREIEVIRRLGVNFVCGIAVGTGVTLEELERTHDVVFVGTGTWQATHLRVPGVESTGVHHALDFLEQVNSGQAPKLGKKVLVIGGGNSAVDSARTALRLGAEVTVVYRRQRAEMPAIPEEVHEAEEEGVRFNFLASPHAVLSDKAGKVMGLEVERTELGDFDASGRRAAVATGQYQRIACDTIILAIGERADARYASAHGVALNKDGTVAADPFTALTSRPHVFAGGDVVTGAANVTTAMGWAKQAAGHIDRQLMGGEARLGQLLPHFTYSNAVPKHPEAEPGTELLFLPASDRRSTFEEVCLGLGTDDVGAESSRCLRCDVKELSTNGAGCAARSADAQAARGGAA